jgi:preprotein translocase subunit SecA
MFNLYNPFNQDNLNTLKKNVEKINKLENEISKLNENEIKERILTLIKKYKIE